MNDIFSARKSSLAPRRFQIRLEDGVTTLGMVPAALPPKQVIVGQVETGSWAQRNGVSVGDELVAVDGMPCVEISVITLDKLLRQVRPLLLTFQSNGRSGHVQSASNLLSSRDMLSVKETQSPTSSRSSRGTNRSRETARAIGGDMTERDSDGLVFEVLHGKDMSLSIVFRLPASDLHACKLLCIKQGYGAFVVHRGTAYFRRESAKRCRLNLTDSPQCTAYISSRDEAACLFLEVDVGGQWVPLEPEVRRMLAEVLARGRTTLQYQCRGSRYEIDLNEMVQTSSLAGIRRKLRHASMAEVEGGAQEAECMVTPSLGLSAKDFPDADKQLLQEVVGTWIYDAFEYEITRTQGQGVFFEQVCTDKKDPSKLHRVSGVLHPQGKWLEGDILYGDAVKLGTIRLWKQPDAETIVSCVKLVDQDQWGRETLAHRVDCDRPRLQRVSTAPCYSAPQRLHPSFDTLYSPRRPSPGKGRCFF